MPPAADASFVEAMARTGHADIAAIRPWIKQQGYRGTRVADGQSNRACVAHDVAQKQPGGFGKISLIDFSASGCNPPDVGRVRAINGSTQPIPQLFKFGDLNAASYRARRMVDRVDRLTIWSKPENSNRWEADVVKNARAPSHYGK